MINWPTIPNRWGGTYAERKEARRRHRQGTLQTEGNIMKATGVLNETTTKIKGYPWAIPNGRYDGVWSGYTVEFTAYGITYIVYGLSYGVRTFGTPCTVDVNDGEIEVSS